MIYKVLALLLIASVLAMGIGSAVVSAGLSSDPSPFPGRHGNPIEIEEPNDDNTVAACEDGMAC